MAIDTWSTCFNRDKIAFWFLGRQKNNISLKLIANYDTDKNVIVNQLNWNWNFRPQGDGRSGAWGSLLPERNLTFLTHGSSRRMMCESMLSTNADIAPRTVALMNQTALRALCFFFSKQTGAYNMQARPCRPCSVLPCIYVSACLIQYNADTPLCACIGMYNKLIVCF